MGIEILNDYKERGLLYSQTHPSLPLIIWNYTDVVQYDDLWDDVTIMCRGLVTDVEGNIVARPFKKFFNLSEGKTNLTNRFEVYEKVDGSLGILFYYDGRWMLASRGSFASDQALKGNELLENVNTSLLNPEFTYCLEIIYKENRIVVDYGDREELVLLAVIDTDTGLERDYLKDVFGNVNKFNFDTSLDELYKYIKDDEEGYVIKFSNGERCKIKGEEYLRLHKMMYSMSTVSIWEAMKSGGSVIDLIEGFPDEFYQRIKEVESEILLNYRMTKFEALNEFSRRRYLQSRKSFAESIESGNPYKSLLFLLLDNKSIEEGVWKLIKPEYKRI